MELITLGSIVRVDTDVVQRQVGRPHTGSLTPLPQRHGDRKFFLTKDFRDALFSRRSKSNSVSYHLNPATPQVRLRRGDRTAPSSDRCHHTTPIGILAEQGCLHQVRSRDGLGHLPCPLHSGCSRHLNTHNLGYTLSVATNGQRERLTSLSQEQQESTEANRPFLDHAIFSGAVRQTQDGIVGTGVSGH